MESYLIYIVPAAVILVIFVGGFAYSRRAAAKYAGQAPGTAQAGRPTNRGVYEAPNVNQQSDHPLGAVQSIIRGRIRFVGFGVLLIAVAAFGLWALWFTDGLTEYTKTALTKAVATVLMAGGVVWGLQLISYSTYRVKLRRTGFELCSVFGTKRYEYRDAELHLSQTIEHKNNSDGYRPVVMSAGNYNYIWQCQILFADGRKPIVLKSSRYAWLKSKMQKAIDALYGDAQ